MNILVTGGAGLIGSSLCRKLIKNKNTSVICVDNYYTSSSENIKDLEKYPRFKFENHDITDPFFIDKIDQIYHLACPASPKHYQKSPLYTSKINSIGTMNILNLAANNKARILFTSTSEVYGDPKVHPQYEEYRGNVSTIGPRSCYTEGKRFSESLMFDYFREYNLDIRICRVFNTYGPFMQFDDGRVISNFILQALRNEPLTIYGSGLQTRSFCYVDDIVDGLVLFMNGNHRGPVNLGSVDEICIFDVAGKIIELCGCKYQLSYLNRPANDPKVRCPDLSLLKKLINWESKVSLEDGLHKTIEWFKERLKNNA